VKYCQQSCLSLGGCLVKDFLHSSRRQNLVAAGEESRKAVGEKSSSRRRE